MTPDRRRPVRLGSLQAALGLALLVALLAPGPGAAQSKSDAFAGKIPPVSASLYRKAGRFEVGLSGNVSVNDAFYSKYFGGLKVGYHFVESMSVHAQFATGLVTKAGSAVVCPSGQGCHGASKEQMYQVPGHIDSISGVEIAWAPVYGKLDAFSERVGHFDLSLMIGADYIKYQKVAAGADIEQARKDKVPFGTPPSVGTFGGHVGLGTRFFLSEWAAVRLEVKDYLYVVPVPNWQEGDGAKKDLQNQIFTELGVTFFFPFHNRPVQ